MEKNWLRVLIVAIGFATILASSMPIDVAEIPTKIEEAEQEGRLPVLDQGNSVAGSDADANGVRDDLDAVITNMDLNQEETEALQQFAASLSSVISLATDGADTEKLPARLRLDNAFACLVQRFPDGQHVLQYQRLQAYVLNSTQRTAAYKQFIQDAMFFGGDAAMSIPAGQSSCDAVGRIPQRIDAQAQTPVRPLQQLQTKAVCETTDFIIAYFPASSMDPVDTLASRVALEELFGPVYGDRELRYKHLSRPSDAAPLDSAQIAYKEWLESLGNAIASAAIESRNSFFWDVVLATFTPNRRSPVTDIRLRTDIRFSGAEHQVRLAMTDSLTPLNTESLTAEEATALHLDVDRWAGQSKKLLLLGHYRGNLFVSEAFDYLARTHPDRIVSAVHFAPLTDQLNGPYFLSENDPIVSRLRSSPTYDKPIPQANTQAFSGGFGLDAMYLSQLPEDIQRTVFDQLLAMNIQEIDAQMAATGCTRQ